jgi:hypothetical protein
VCGEPIFFLYGTFFQTKRPIDTISNKLKKTQKTVKDFTKNSEEIVALTPFAHNRNTSCSIIFQLTKSKDFN